jgi:transcriptional regulator GlxA family with amidase domain
MQIVIVLFDRLTVLDAIGPYEVFDSMPGAEVCFAAERTGPFADERGAAQLNATITLAKAPRPDVIVVPGGAGELAHRGSDSPLNQWLREADQSSTWTTSVCTGSLILAGAGLLTGRRATSHWLALDTLGGLGAIPARERVVSDGKYVTAAGVSAGIDMALTLVGRIAGEQTAQAVQLAIEYDPQPPYDAGSPDKAPEAIVSALRASSRFILAGQR